MLQIGTKNVYLYLPADEEGMVELGGEYEDKLKRWRFPLSSQSVVTNYVKLTYPQFFEEEEDDDDDEEDEDFSPHIDKRLHRAKSFSQYEEDEEEESDLERSRSRSQKYKECDRCRPPLSNKQFSTKRSLIKSRMN